jgi:hypothetical protein
LSWTADAEKELAAPDSRQNRNSSGALCRSAIQRAPIGAPNRVRLPQLWPEGCVIDPSLWRVDVEIGWHDESATYHRGADRGA